MSNAVSALQGKSFDGYCKVSDAGLRGMITLRMDGQDKILNRLTTPDEVLRVTQMDMG